MESDAATTKMNRRHGPLHACGVSISAIAFKAYTKARDFNGPIGSTTKRVAKFATSTFPFVHAMQCQWLAFLSFTDDHILAIEKIIETLFPPSTRLFNKLDELVRGIEDLPSNFDDAVSKFPILIHRVPFLDWALACLISWLKFFTSTLTHWGSKTTREKEIMVDVNCNNLNEQVCFTVESPSHTSEIVCQEHCPMESVADTHPCETVERLDRVSDSWENETTFKSALMKCSYKQMLEKGKEETSTDRKEDSFKEDSPKAIATEKQAAESWKKDENEQHPILELFESSWHTIPGKGR